jgi:ribonuclease Z
MARLVVVGSGTVVPEGDRSGSSFFYEAGSARVLIDCGPAAVQSMARLRVPWQDLTDVVLTHFHTDHVGDLPALFFSLTYGLMPDTRETPLDVWGPPGVTGVFAGLEAALGDYFTNPGFTVRVHEVGPGAEVRLEGGPFLRTHKTPHTPESQAVILDHGTGRIGYTGDSGPSTTLGGFLAGLTALACECSLPDHLVGDNHLSPASVARIAGEARPDVLLLTHIYPQFREASDVPGLVREAGYHGNIEVARDGLVVPLGDG